MPLLVEGAGSPPNNVAWAEAYLRTKRHLDPSNRLATIDMVENWGLLCPFGGARSPSNTMWPGRRPTSIPSGMLIHPTVWPQHTVTDRTDRQRSNSIGRTVLQTVAQKAYLSSTKIGIFALVKDNAFSFRGAVPPDLGLCPWTPRYSLALSTRHYPPTFMTKFTPRLCRSANCYICFTLLYFSYPTTL